MGKRLIAVLALALVVGLTFSAAYAEVQNVKVSGDIIVSGIARNNFDFGVGAANNNDQNLFATQTRVRIDADLTDNVMATVRLINERNWSSETVASTDIDLDLAYVTLKEFLYSPLTLTVGRQELRFGNALIVGNGNRLVNDSTPVNELPRDLTSRKAFDAIRATLNYDPLIIDAVYSKVTNVNTNLSDDIDLYGINVSYDLSKKLNVQAYVWDKTDKSAALADSKKDDVATIGALISASPIENLKASFEGALQTGHNRRSDEANVKQHRGFALQGLADYTFAKTKYTPNLGVGYTYLSGNSKKVTGWDPIFTDQRLNSIVYAILPYTNMTVYNVKGSVKPVEDVTLSANYGYYLLNKSVANITNAYTGTAMAINSNKKNLGSELDLTATYDYTEDVQLGLTAGAFWKGTAFAGSKGDNATQLIGSMKVIF